MTTFTTRCPSCNSLNRVPFKRVSESGSCGKCKSALLDGAPIEGTVNNVSALIDSNIPVVIDFWAPWCNPCVGFAPVFEQAAKERSGTVRFLKINTEENQLLASQYQIRSIPTIMLFKKGKKLDMVSGALPKGQFDSWLMSALNRA